MVRERLTANMVAGVNPRSAALEIMGRVNRATGLREGGILGLDRPRLAQRDRALANLRSGNPDLMRDYLRLRRRDRTFDAAVEAAIRNGRPVPADLASKIIGRLEARLLYDRGTTIGRTELLGSLHHAQDEAMQQVIDMGAVRPDQVSAEWDAADDDDTRKTHADADGQQMGPDGFFLIGGYRMAFPGDDSQGAPAKEIVLCRCRKRISIDFVAGLKPGD